MTRVFRAEPLLDVIRFVEQGLAAGPVTIHVPDPDRGRGHYSGELVGGLVHRSLRTWLDLAERVGARLATPRAVGDELVELVFEPLGPRARFDDYGAGSVFARTSKLEEPGFVLDFADAIARVAPRPGARVLDLGVNTGDELALLRRLAPAIAEADLVGVDHSASALAIARERFPRARFVEAGLDDLAAHDLGQFDLVISIATLQSPRVDDRALLRHLVQDHLTERGSIVLGVPNCRYRDGELEHGTRMKNFTQPELGLLVKDVAFYRKYLQQHRRTVYVTGKHYVLVTAIPGE